MRVVVVAAAVASLEGEDAAERHALATVHLAIATRRPSSGERHVRAKARTCATDTILDAGAIGVARAPRSVLAAPADLALARSPGEQHRESGHGAEGFREAQWDGWEEVAAVGGSGCDKPAKALVPTPITV